MKYNVDVVLDFYKEQGIELVPEYKFLEDKGSRFDFAIPDLKIAIEVEGGVWRGGRHTRPLGFIADMEKYNKAALQGWMVLRVLPSDITMNDTRDMVKEAVEKRLSGYDWCENK
jgi:very-short-patch-repair endonuclease